MGPLVVAITLLQFHGPTGQRIDINPDGITSIRDPHAMTEHWAKGTHCIIVMANGRFIAVNEECDAVRTKVQGSCVLVCGGER